MATLNLPPTAKIVQKKRCKVSSIEFASYINRTSFAPLAEVSVVIDNMAQGDLDSLVSQIATATGVEALQMPYLSGEDYLVQAVKVRPIVYGVNGSIELTMIEQRKVSVPENRSLVLVTHSPIEGSFKEESSRVWSLQYAGGIQKTKRKSNTKKSETVWDVIFHLSQAQALLLDQQLTAKRGIYPFDWSPGGEANKAAWLCSEWQFEYHCANLVIFNGKLLFYASSTSLTSIALSASPLYIQEGAGILAVISLSAVPSSITEGT